MPSQSPGDHNIRPLQVHYHRNGVPEKSANSTSDSGAIDRRYGDPQTDHSFRVSSKSSEYGVKKPLQNQKFLLALMRYGSTLCKARQFRQR